MGSSRVEKAPRRVSIARCPARRVLRVRVGTGVTGGAGQKSGEGSATFCLDESLITAESDVRWPTDCLPPAALRLNSESEGPCGILAAASWRELELRGAFDLPKKPISLTRRSPPIQIAALHPLALRGAATFAARPFRIHGKRERRALLAWRKPQLGCAVGWLGRPIECIQVRPQYYFTKACCAAEREAATLD